MCNLVLTFAPGTPSAIELLLKCAGSDVPSSLKFCAGAEPLNELRAAAAANVAVDEVTKMFLVTPSGAQVEISDDQTVLELKDGDTLAFQTVLAAFAHDISAMLARTPEGYLDMSAVRPNALVQASP